MNIQEKKQELVKEFNTLENRQKEIIGELKILGELEGEDKLKEDKKDGGDTENNKS